jgi:hypothetical protein
LTQLSRSVSSEELQALTGLAPDEIELISVLAAREAAAVEAAKAKAQARRERFALPLRRGDPGDEEGART